MPKPTARFIGRLAIEFLRELSERYGSDGCNDWDWPDWVTPAQRKAIKAMHPDAATDPDLVKVQESEMNWVIVDCIIAALEADQHG